MPAGDALQPLAPAFSRMDLVSPSELGQLKVITVIPLLMSYLDTSLHLTPIGGDFTFESCLVMYERSSPTFPLVFLQAEVGPVRLNVPSWTTLLREVKGIAQEMGLEGLGWGLSPGALPSLGCGWPGWSMAGGGSLKDTGVGQFL